MREIIIIQHCQSEHHVNNMSGGWTVFVNLKMVHFL